MDFLDNMEDVKQAPTPSRTSPGDLGFLAAAAARLSQANVSDERRKGEEGLTSPLHRQQPLARRREVAEERTRCKSPRRLHNDKENRRDSPCRNCDLEKNRRESPPDRTSPHGPRHANSSLPHDLFFTVPKNCRPGQPVCVQGPHGPLNVPLPQGYQPGEQCRVRFGPMALHVLIVPQGKGAGDTVKFEGADGEDLEAKVPQGKTAGDVFEVSPPALMVQVPDGTKSGDQITFTAPDGTERGVEVPKGVQPTQYFPVKI